MDLNFTSASKKQDVFKQVEEHLIEKGFTIVSRDVDRPWGGFFVIDEEQARRFSHVYFGSMEVVLSQMVGKLSPKFLIVEPGKRLSWQYHHRRSEVWKLVAGKAGVATSRTDDQGPVEELQVNKVIQLSQGQRHRLVGLDSWGVVAEIWQHTDPNHASDENDIVRLEDDYGR